MRVAWLPALALLLVPHGISAQAPEEEAVLSAVSGVFDGMREADGAKVRDGFTEGARFAAVDDGDGAERVVFSEVDGWIRAIDGSEGRWEEILYDVEVQVDGDMASVWAPYTFYLDGELSHCGINSIELLRAGESWKITQLADTRRTDGCPTAR